MNSPNMPKKLEKKSVNEIPGFLFDFLKLEGSV